MNNNIYTHRIGSRNTGRHYQFAAAACPVGFLYPKQNG